MTPATQKAAAAAVAATVLGLGSVLRGRFLIPFASISSSSIRLAATHGRLHSSYTSSSYLLTNTAAAARLARAEGSSLVAKIMPPAGRKGKRSSTTTTAAAAAAAAANPATGGSYTPIPLPPTAADPSHTMPSPAATAAAGRKRKLDDKNVQKFYAVRAGARPGIYLTWHECQAQIAGFKGAQCESMPFLFVVFISLSFNC